MCFLSLEKPSKAVSRLGTPGRESGGRGKIPALLPQEVEDGVGRLKVMGTAMIRIGPSADHFICDLELFIVLFGATVSLLAK